MNEILILSSEFPPVGGIATFAQAHKGLQETAAIGSDARAHQRVEDALFVTRCASPQFDGASSALHRCWGGALLPRARPDAAWPCGPTKGWWLTCFTRFCHSL